MAIDILQQRMSRGDVIILDGSLKRSLLALLYMSSNVIRIIKESPPTLCSIDSSCCVGKFATGRHSLVKTSAGQSKRLNLGDVLVTRNRFLAEKCGISQLSVMSGRLVSATTIRPRTKADPVTANSQVLKFASGETD